MIYYVESITCTDVHVYIYSITQIESSIETNYHYSSLTGLTAEGHQITRAEACFFWQKQYGFDRLLYPPWMKTSLSFKQKNQRIPGTPAASQMNNI